MSDIFNLSGEWSLFSQCVKMSVLPVSHCLFVSCTVLVVTVCCKSCHHEFGYVSKTILVIRHVLSLLTDIYLTNFYYNTVDLYLYPLLPLVS